MQKVLKLLFRLDVEKTRFFIREGFDVKDFLLFLTAFASVSGIILLTLWVVNVVQIRIGLYSCGSAEARKAIWALCSIVAIALVIYVVSIIVGIIASIRGHADSHPDPDQQGQSSDKGNNKGSDVAAAVQGAAVQAQTQDALV